MSFPMTHLPSGFSVQRKKGTFFFVKGFIILIQLKELLEDLRRCVTRRHAGELANLA